MLARNLKGLMTKEAGGVGSATATYQDTASRDGSSISTHTHSSISFGTVSNNNYICVAVGVFSANVDRHPSSVTAGGVTLTEISGANGGSSAQYVYVGKHNATSGDVVINFTTGISTSGIGVWNIEANSETPYASTSNSFVSTIDVDVPEGGCVVCGCMEQNGSAVTFTGVDEDYDYDMRSGEYISGGHRNELSADTTYTISVTSERRVMTTLSWE